MDKPVFDWPEAASGHGDDPRLEKKLPEWASNLEDNVDSKILVMLRDGRKLVGWLRTFDQFANLLLEHVVERHFADSFYADVHLGTMLIRGENVCLFGDIDPAREPGLLREAPLAFVLQREAALEAEEAARGIVRPTDIFLEAD
mmetsp:Transcript_3708/g.9531  ORF Transcript_3708/g.9531 Transcript_3708/m.9531 type:complete len:144 (-) Transcript_3708:81-512(-)